MKKLLKRFLALTIALPATVFAAESRVEKIEQSTEEQRAELRKSTVDDISEAEQKLRDLTNSLDSLRSSHDTKKKAAILGASVTSVSAAMGIILTLNIKKTNPAARIATANLFGVLTAVTALSTAENAHDAYLDNQKIDDLQAEILGVQGNLATLKKQLEQN
jgi:hypothetical protein